MACFPIVVPMEKSLFQSWRIQPESEKETLKRLEKQARKGMEMGRQAMNTKRSASSQSAQGPLAQSSNIQESGTAVFAH